MSIAAAAPSRIPVPRGAGFVIVTVLFALAAICAAAAAFWPVYQHPRYWLVAGAAIGIGVVIAVLGSVLRLPGVVVLLATVVVYAATGVQLAIPSATTAGGLLPTGSGALQLLSETALGWRHLVTITLPVGDYQALLVPAYASVLAATVASVSIALRARRGELGTIPPLLLYVLAILFGPSRTGDAVPLALVFLAVLLLWMVWRRGRRRRDALRILAGDGARRERSGALRAGVAAVIVLALASAASVAATASVATSNRTVLRTVVAQPFDPRDYPSPLAGLRRYLKDGRDDQAMLTVRGLPQDGRVRIATLDSYDGVVYAVGSSAVDSDSGTFVRVPTSVQQNDPGATPVTATITVDGYRGVWVPTIGDLESIEFSGADAERLRGSFYFNTTSSTGALLGGVTAGDTYRITALQPAATGLDQLESATPGSARQPAIESMPDAVSTKLEEYASGIEGPGAQLVAAIRGLRRDGYISHGIDPADPPSRSGHGADRITELLTGQRMIGDAEQYSVAAALMARQLGFPSRVVFGFVPERTNGTVTLTGKDISAWIEVETGSGWVTIDPVPPVRPIPEEQPKDPTQVARPQTPVEPPADEPQRREDQTPPDTQQSDSDEPNAVLVALLAVLRVGGWVALGLGLLASPLLLIVAAKARRRRLRRRAPTPLESVRGAWDEFRDQAVDHGWVVSPTATRAEFADAVGLEQSKTLAAVADRAVFAPGALQRQDADRVWTAFRDLSESLGRGMNRRARFRAIVSVRSLGGFAVRRLWVRPGAAR